MFSKVFRIGDYIEIGTVRGQVQAVNLTSTILRTLEDARVIVPNRRSWERSSTTTPESVE
jgi:small-conductance mechanosensitive channel